MPPENSNGVLGGPKIFIALKFVDEESLNRLKLIIANSEFWVVVAK